MALTTQRKPRRRKEESINILSTMGSNTVGFFSGCLLDVLAASQCIFILAASQCIFILAASQCIFVLAASQCIFVLAASQCIFVLAASQCIFVLAASQCIFVLAASQCVLGTDLLRQLQCCHTVIEAADQTCYLTQSQDNDTQPTSPSTAPIRHLAGQPPVDF